jgi:hypothetical protein
MTRETGFPRAVAGEVAAVVAEARRTGRRGIRQVYGSVGKTRGWRDEGTFLLVDCGPGKNGADMRLALDAFEAALSGIGSIIVVSSDGDFTPLALGLAELGVRITGMGEPKTPDAFRKACDSFITFGAPAQAPRRAPLSDPKPACDRERIARWVETVIGHSDAKERALAALGSRMHQHRNLRKADLPEGDWAAFLQTCPRFEIVAEASGRRIVRFARRR